MNQTCVIWCVFKGFAMKKDLVKKDNSLTEALYSLTVVEYRILHMAFSSLAECEVNPDFFKNVRITISASNYMELYQVDRNTAYQAIKDASDKLFHRYFSYDEVVNKDLMLYERVKSRWVSKVGYNREDKSISLWLTPDVLGMVGNLKEQYTYFQLKQTINLDSIYAVRIYEMLMQWRKTKTVPCISVVELRDRLGIGEKEYTRIFDFKKYVLETAVQQINKNTDIIVSYEQEKQGRNITGFLFRYEDKEDKNKKNNKQIDWVGDKKTAKFYKLSGLQLETFASKLAESRLVDDLANVGEKMTEFKQRLRQMLNDPNRQHKLHEALAKIGFVPTR